MTNRHYLAATGNVSDDSLRSGERFAFNRHLDILVVAPLEGSDPQAGSDLDRHLHLL